MRGPLPHDKPVPIRLYAMLTWTTLRRLPLIHSRAAAFLRRVLPEIARRHDARVIELGIVRNHVHLVLELPARVDIPRLVQGLKGASARIANRDGIMLRARLRWAARARAPPQAGVRGGRSGGIAVTAGRSHRSNRWPDHGTGMTRPERARSAGGAPLQGAHNAEPGLSARVLIGGLSGRARPRARRYRAHVTPSPGSQPGL